jgi:undecaprenyl-diphosphatase
MIALSVISLPLAYIFSKITSIIYFDPRPFVVGHFTPLITHAPDNGFPSDHMLLASAIASIIFAYNKKLGVVAWVIAFVVGASRVLAGVHHWIDILGSAVIAVGTMWLVKRYIMPRLEKTRFFSNFFC